MRNVPWESVLDRTKCDTKAILPPAQGYPTNPFSAFFRRRATLLLILRGIGEIPAPATRHMASTEVLLDLESHSILDVFPFRVPDAEKQRYLLYTILSARIAEEKHRPRLYFNTVRAVRIRLAKLPQIFAFSESFRSCNTSVTYVSRNYESKFRRRIVAFANQTGLLLRPGEREREGSLRNEDAGVHELLHRDLEHVSGISPR